MNKYTLLSIIGIIILVTVAIFGGYKTGYQKGQASMASSSVLFYIQGAHDILEVAQQKGLDAAVQAFNSSVATSTHK